MKWKPVLFSLVAIGGALLLAEVVLALAGVQPLASREDPFRGFSEKLRVFETDASTGVVRTTSRATEHTFNAQEFPAVKTAAEFRVFVLGGSSAYGFPWGSRRAFSAALETSLQASMPDREVHVVNAAAMSYGSLRLRILAHEIAGYEPDLVVLYSGHNEFVERELYGRVSSGPPLPDGLRLLLHRWRLYSALARLLAPAPERDDTPQEAQAGELLGFDADRRYASDVLAADREIVRASFDENLRAIVATLQETGADVVLCTVPSNEKGWRPNQTAWPGELSAADRNAATRAIERAREANDGDDPEAALRAIAEVETLSTVAAESWFEKGRALLALDRGDEAATAFATARDLDGQPGRALGALNDTLREVASATGVTLVDTDRVFRDLAADGIPGFDLFEDYVHPKPRAHLLIAREIWRAQVGATNDGAFHDALGLAPDFDFTAESDAPEAIEGGETSSLLFNLAVVLENQGRYDDAMERYRRCLELNPGYYVARANLGRLLRLTGDPQQAAQEYAMVLNMAPDHLNSAIGLGESFRELGIYDQAERAFRRATEIDADAPGAWNGLGTVYLVTGRHREAERAFTRTVELDPDNLPVRANLGMSIFFQGRLDDARVVFEESLARRADDPGAMNGMGAIAIERNDPAAAEEWFTRVLALDPNDALARNGLEEARRRSR